MEKRYSKRLENGEIQLSSDLENKISKIRKNGLFSVSYDTEEKIKNVINESKVEILYRFAKAINKERLEKIMDKHIAPCIKLEDYRYYLKPSHPLNHIIIKLINDVETLYVRKKVLIALRKKISITKTGLEKDFILCCKEKDYRNKIFPELVAYIEDIYENLYSMTDTITNEISNALKVAEQQLKQKKAEYNATIEY